MTRSLEVVMRASGPDEVEMYETDPFRGIRAGEIAEP
jgi:hypothetical protein